MDFLLRALNTWPATILLPGYSLMTASLGNGWTSVPKAPELIGPLLDQLLKELLMGLNVQPSSSASSHDYRICAILDFLFMSQSMFFS